MKTNLLTISEEQNRPGPPSLSPVAADPAAVEKSQWLRAKSQSFYIDGEANDTTRLLGGRVTVNQHAQVSANISAHEVVVSGAVHVNITAGDCVAIRCEGSLTGRAIAQRISIADGGFCKGYLEISKPDR
jgi:cytoskeletal protein CcmA (bactofilin family)